MSLFQVARTIIFRIGAVMIIIYSVLAAKGDTRNVAWMSPEKPHRGDSITVQYRLNDPTSAFQHAHSVLVVGYFFTGFPDDPAALPVPIVREVEMTRVDTMLNARFALDIPDVQFMIYKFESVEEVDNNNGELWNSLVYDSTNRPVMHANEAKAWAFTGYATDSTYQIHRDISLAYEAITAELKDFPESVSAWNMYFMLERMHSLGISIPLSDKIDSIMNHFAPDATEFSAPRIAKWFSTIGKQTKLASFENHWLETHATGNYRLQIEFSRAKSIKRGAEMVIAVRNLVLFTVKDSGWAVTMVREWLLNYYIQSGKSSEAENIWRMIGTGRSDDAVRIAKTYFESGKELKRALALMHEVVDRESINPTFAQSPSLTMHDRMERQTALNGNVEAMIGRLEESLGEVDSSLIYYSKALMLSQMQDTSVMAGMLRMVAKRPMDDITGRILAMLVKSTSEFPSLQLQADRMYVKLNDPPRTLSLLHTQAIQVARKMQERKFCRRVLRLMEPKWTCTTMDGKQVSSKDYLGKVLVLDFWGTWCVPCKVTMPQFEKLASRFAKDSGVVFLSVNTHEQVFTVDSIRDVIKTFLRDSTFENVHFIAPIVMDTDYAMSRAFNVEFFPTFMIIDRNGVLRIIQYSNPESDVADDLESSVDIIREGLCSNPTPVHQ